MITIDSRLTVAWGFTVEDIIIVWLWGFITLTIYMMLRRVDYPKSKTKTFDRSAVAMFNSLLVIVLGWDTLIFGGNISFIDINEDNQVTLCSDESRMCVIFDPLPRSLGHPVAACHGVLYR